MRINKTINSLFLIPILIIFLFPIFVSAQNDPPKRYSEGGFSLVQCDGVTTAPGEVKCNFAQLVNMANYLIKWLFYITVPIIVALFAYSGFLHMTGKQANIDQSKKILFSVLKGFIIMLIAWFLVSTLLKWLVNPDFKGADTLINQQK